VEVVQIMLEYMKTLTMAAMQKLVNSGALDNMHKITAALKMA
jgi:hypothetical protein